MKKDNDILRSSSAGEYSKRLEEVNLEGLASRWVEETFNSINLEGIKRSLVELLGIVVRDVEIEIHGCRNKNAKQRKVEEAEQIGAFLEEELIFSMLHSGWDVSSSPIDEFESPCPVS